METLALFNNCLALIIVFNVNCTIPKRYFNIWVMREYGVEDSWTKQLVVGPLKGIQKPVGFVKNEELIILRDDEDQTIALYNIGSQEIKNFQHSGLPNSFRSRHARLYVESLVSLNGGRA
ncbi:hypothetical protein RGQ29_015711 [Quercus rubra]|uniref:F-box protein n=1 Tax=Quercus rubra TaxID=3512 RepID=A0AAN7J4S6_QUERU|nr:hypothetical protein RGQ29_015711 [Quercus rubra]